MNLIFGVSIYHIQTQLSHRAQCWFSKKVAKSIYPSATVVYKDMGIPDWHQRHMKITGTHTWYNNGTDFVWQKWKTCMKGNVASSNILIQWWCNWTYKPMYCTANISIGFFNRRPSRIPLWTMVLITAREYQWKNGIALRG